MQMVNASTAKRHVDLLRNGITLALQRVLKSSANPPSPQYVLANDDKPKTSEVADIAQWAVSREIGYYLRIREDKFEREKSVATVFERFVSSVSNKTRAGSMLKSADRQGKGRKVLGTYDPAKIHKKWGFRYEALCDAMFVGKMTKMRMEMARCLLNAAGWFCQEFPTYEHFREKVYDKAVDLKSTLHIVDWIVGQDFPGFKFALTCDFIKELGVPWIGKPDRHVLARIMRLGDAPDVRSAMELLYDMYVALGRDMEYCPVAIDKVLWLFGSGRFDRTFEPPLTVSKNAKIDALLDMLVEHG